MYTKGPWPVIVDMQPHIHIESWINDHAAMSLSRCVPMSDEKRACHSVRFCEYSTLVLPPALITPRLFLRATACQSVLFSLALHLCHPSLVFPSHHASTRMSSVLLPILPSPPDPVGENPRSTRCSPPLLLRVHFSERSPPRG